MIANSSIGEFNITMFFKASDGSTLSAGALYAMLTDDTHAVKSTAYDWPCFAVSLACSDPSSTS